jgi:hypothetical protein
MRDLCAEIFENRQWASSSLVGSNPADPPADNADATAVGAPGERLAPLQPSVHVHGQPLAVTGSIELENALVI